MYRIPMENPDRQMQQVVGTAKPTPPAPVIDGKTQRAALVIAGLAAFLAPFMGSSINIALPSIGRDFQMSAVLLGWLGTSYSLAGGDRRFLPAGGGCRGVR